MRTIEELRVVQRLVKRGLNDCEIGRRTGIPRGTVRDWRHGRIPRRYDASEPKTGCARCGHPDHDPAELPPREYAYLLGLYLGDGCISAHARKVFKLRISLDQKYPVIIRECGRAMASVCPTSATGQVVCPGCIEVYSYSRAWPCLFPQHGPGMKHQRPIRLTAWQDEIAISEPRMLLRGLIHSDGCRVINRVKGRGKTYCYPRYFFSNTSTDIQRIFCRYCDLVGVSWRQDGPKNISVARRGSVARLDEFIGPKR